MAKEIKQKVKQKKVTKKSFYEVSAPITATKIHLYASGPEELNGKTILLDLTKSLRGKSLELKMRVHAEKEELIAIPESVTLTGSYIRRTMRKGTDYCEDSFKTETKDALVQVKPFFIARKRVSRGILRALRETAQRELIKYLKTRTTDEIFKEIMTNKLQKQLSLKLKKIYPLALCEIRTFEALEALGKKPVEKEMKESQQ